MTVLTRKLLRDLRHSRSAIAIILAIIAVGTGSFIGLRSSQRMLIASQAAYYRDFHFADFWVDVKRAPQAALDGVRAMPGVDRAQARVAFDVIVDLPNVTRPIGGRLLTVSESRPDAALNGICLIRGSHFSGRSRWETILNEAFAQAHGLAPGDDIPLILNGRREAFRVVGTAISPEYVYMVQGEGDFLPDPEHFAVLYVQEKLAKDVLDYAGAFNQLVGRLAPGGDVDVVLERIERRLAPYGVLAATPRRRQASHLFLSDEIAELGVSSIVMPLIFLAVAALVLNIMMIRLVGRQRVVIGTLKALGCTNGELLRHFCAFGLVVGVLGGVAGAAIGIPLSAGMLKMYRQFFQFPAFLFDVHVDLIVLGVVVSVLFAVGGTLRGGWLVLRLAPAEAMRPSPPETFGRIWLERLTPLWRRLGFRWHIALRSLSRNRIRTATSVISIAMAVAMVFSTLGMLDAIYFLIDFQFERVTRSDVDIGMRDETTFAALQEARRLPGVDYAEAMLSMACDLRNGRHARRIGVVGLPAGARLTTPITVDGERIVMPPEGLVISRKLADILGGLQQGDAIEMTPARGQRRTRRPRVAMVSHTYLGLACYARRDYLERLMGESSAVNVLQLQVNPARADDLYRALKQLPNAQGLAIRADIRANIEDTIARTIGFSLSVLILFAGVIAFGSTLNNSLVELGDRIREVSTFRVLGYQPGFVSGIFLRQSLALFAIGAALGLPMGYGLNALIVLGYDRETLRIPLVVGPLVPAASVAVCLVFVLVAEAALHRAVKRLDWLEGIKVKE